MSAEPVDDITAMFEDADSDMDDCVLMSGLQGALAAVEEQKAVKVEQVEEQAEPDEIEQHEEGTGAASSDTKRKDTRVRGPGRKRQALTVGIIPPMSSHPCHLTHVIPPM